MSLYENAKLVYDDVEGPRGQLMQMYHDNIKVDNIKDFIVSESVHLKRDSMGKPPFHLALNYSWGQYGPPSSGDMIVADKNNDIIARIYLNEVPYSIKLRKPTRPAVVLMRPRTED